MSFIAKPKVANPGLPRNPLGLNRRDYEGSMSTLCAGCGHDSVTAALVQACFELALPPQSVVKLSGIGCSSKTTAYFVAGAHGFNSVHGRMPSIATEPSREPPLRTSASPHAIRCRSVSQRAHVLRRTSNAYILETRRYGLTRASSRRPRTSLEFEDGLGDEQEPIDPVLLALALGASFVARSFSGDKEQLVPLIQAGLAHRGFAIIDVLSPCVTFNDHEGSTKSYAYVREHSETPVSADYIAPKQEIRVQYGRATVSVPVHYFSTSAAQSRPDRPTDRARAAAMCRSAMKRILRTHHVDQIARISTRARPAE